MRQLGVGVIGTGMAFERLHLPAYRSLPAQYRIVALCNENVDEARSWAQRLGLPPDSVEPDPDQLARRDDVDVIDIIVPIPDNFPMTQRIAQAVAHSSKGIICEKPLAANRKEANAARKLPQKYGIPIMIAENYRFDEETNRLRQMVAEKWVGDPVFFIQNRVLDMPRKMLGNTFEATEWRQHPDFHGGVILDTGVHDIAALHHILGPVSEVHAYGVPQDDDFAPYAVLQAALKFSSGVIGQYTFYTAGREPQRPLVGLRLFCTAGMLYLEQRDCGIVNVFHEDGRSEQVPYTPGQGYRRELLNFHDHLTTGAPLQVPPETEFGDTSVLLAMLRSAEDGKRVVLEPEPAFAH